MLEVAQLTKTRVLLPTTPTQSPYKPISQILEHIRSSMKEGEKEEIDVDIKIPSTILRGVLDNSPKGKAEDAIDYRSCKPKFRPVAGTATGRSEKVRNR